MKASIRYSLIAVGVAGAIAVGSVALDFAVLRGRTPGLDAPRSVASLEKVRINGAEQWVLVRGLDREKPVLLFLHGGPGMPAMFLAHAFQRDLEHDFVIVHWDRRGAGKSFDAGTSGASLSVSQTLEDTFELTRQLRSRFGRERIYLAGHSWGSYLGLLAIRGHPEYYRAYIGMGQLAGSRAEARALQRAALNQLARAVGESPVAADAGAPASDVSEDDLFRAGGELHASRSFWPILMTGLMAPEYTFRDALNVKRGADLVARAMTYDFVPKPMEGEIAGFDVPVFFFLGRYDLNTPSKLAADYLDRLDAPLKRLVWFEQSAHFPFFEEPDAFHREMVRADAAVSRFWNDRAGASPSPVR